MIDPGVSIRTEIMDDLSCVVIESASVACGILPELGGKMCFLTDRRTGREWLRPDGAVYRPARYGDGFEDYDRSGFDECFPAIAVGEYPWEPWKGTMIVDHGELWTIPWTCEATDTSIRMQVRGVRFPYTFNKELSLHDDALSISYSVQNHSSSPMPCLWSAHPLFLVREGMRVLIPEHSRMVIDYSKDERLGGKLDEISWPIATGRDGKEADLHIIGLKDIGFADKVYTCHLKEGYASLYDPASQDYVAFTFDTREIPHLGIWINQGGWPFLGETDYNMALEPCNGYPDKLATDAGEHSVIPPDERLAWRLRLMLGTAESEEGLRHELSQRAATTARSKETQP